MSNQKMVRRQDDKSQSKSQKLLQNVDFDGNSEFGTERDYSKPQKEDILMAEPVGSASSDQEKLELDLADEMEMKACLDTSIKQLEASIKEIEKRTDSIAEESNEWKTRFETQADMNKFLDRKIVEMQSKADTMRKTIRTGALYETNQDAGYFNELAERLEAEKAQLESQLADMNWKLDKETKAFIKANEERKQYYLEISTCSSVIEDLKAKLRAHRKQAETSYTQGVRVLAKYE